MAKSTSFVAVHRELLVVKHCFAKQLDLLNLIVRRLGEPSHGFRLESVDFGLDLRNLYTDLRCQYLISRPSVEIRDPGDNHTDSRHTRKYDSNRWPHEPSGTI